MLKIDITGQRFGRLVAIEDAGRTKRKEVLWLCRCDCGAEKIVSASHLRQGNIRSCKCLTREITRQNSLKHGHRVNRHHSDTYRSWAAMLTRCYNKNTRCYKNYGGRGIFVCERWHSFENFLADMGERPE